MRRFARHPTDIPIDVKVSTLQPRTESGCCMTTVGQGGLSCQLADRVRVGARVDIDIASVSPAYHGCGEVVWCQQRGDCFEVGVCFTDKDEAFKARMVQQVCQIEHYKNMIFEQEGRLLDGDEAARAWIDKYAADFN